MSLRELTCYQVVCDACGKSPYDLHGTEVTGFVERSDALTEAEGYDWQLGRKDYCPQCAGEHTEERRDDDYDPIREIRATADTVAKVALDLAVIAGQLGQHATAAAAEHVTRVDHLHNEIEAAHERWWHRFIGVRWEMTGWSRG